MALPLKRRRLRRNPTPSAVSELVQCCLRLGRLEDACRYADWGRQRFPQSAIVMEIRRIAEREQAKTDMRQAREQAHHNPSPETLLGLARNAVRIQDAVTAVRALRECIQRFPTCGPAHAALAEIQERRYLRDLAAADGKEVIRLLQRACRLEQGDARARLRLARFLTRIGAIARARATTQQLLKDHPGCAEAKDLLANMPAACEDEEALDDLLQQIEERGQLPGDRQDSTRMRREVDRLTRRLPLVREATSATGALVVDADGDAWDDHGATEPGPLAHLVSNLAHSAHLCARRSGLGPLRGATLEGTNGAVVLRRGFRCTLAAHLPDGASILGTQEALARALTVGPAGKGVS